MDMKWSHTQRGFALCEFEDRMNNPCSIQESSASQASIWIGMSGDKHNMRMHLTQEQVRALLPCLVGFAVTGELTPSLKNARLDLSESRFQRIKESTMNGVTWAKKMFDTKWKAVCWSFGAGVFVGAVMLYPAVNALFGS